jgi:alpha-N-arabinofuranosidase
MRLRNPILPGFHPDPSVCRVGADYYLVNSSFEYFPGVPIFHSRDLVHWRQLGHVLTRPSQLPLAQAAPSDGIYAPTLRHHAGKFYLATTNHFTGSGFRNFFVTADDPAGPWSDPIWVDQGGIDPSLFFAADGKVYWTGNGTGWAAMRGVYQSEIDPVTGRRLTEPRLIWTGSGGSYPEGPHLFQRGEHYYLLVAEGGTAEGHMVTIARARTPFGPFEPCPHNPILTHRSLMAPITSTGHADFVEDHRGQWWAVFLGIRYAQHGFHPLGRETCLAAVDWTDDGWPIVNDRKILAEEFTEPRLLPPHPWPDTPERDDFDGPSLAPTWVQLRNPSAGHATLGQPAGTLSLRCAAASLDERESPAAVFRRQQHFTFTARARLEFEPQGENEEAGLTVLLDSSHHAEIVITRRAGHRVAFVRRRIGSLVGEGRLFVLPDGPVELTLRGDRQDYHFALTRADRSTTELGRHELRYLCTEVAGGYTGVMLGLFATGHGVTTANTARFAWFDYLPSAA